MADNKVSMPRFEVKLMGREAFEVTITQGAQVRYDEERLVRQWPPMEEAQTLWATFVAWASSVRRGLVEDGMPFDVFRDDLEELTYLAAAEAPPTRSGRGGGSRSN
jgi:hypothetical protein